MKKLILLLSTLIWLEAHSPSPPVDANWEIAKQNDLNWKELLTPSNVYNFLVRQNIMHVEIVFRQIIQETGHLTSKLCTEYNNLFAMMTPEHRKTYAKGKIESGYAFYDNWKKSIADYKLWQEHQIKRGKDLSDYYTFLSKVRYAKDSLYVAKLKQINVSRYGL